MRVFDIGLKPIHNHLIFVPDVRLHSTKKKKKKTGEPVGARPLTGWPWPLSLPHPYRTAPDVFVTTTRTYTYCILFVCEMPSML